MHQPPSDDTTDLRESPHHGFQGDRGAPPAVRRTPVGLTVAISRESGARGGTIGRRAARKLGWQVFDQELLEYMAQEAAVNPAVLESTQGPSAEWVEARLQHLLRSGEMSDHPSMVELARIVLALASQGEVVLIGRGAGHILPRETTLHVRVIAPLEDRIAYMAQWQRLTDEEAAARVEQSDARRAEFMSTHFRRQPQDIHLYDLLLNSSLLGEDVCADLVVHAATARAGQLAPREPEEEPPSTQPQVGPGLR
jgi:cytidylate kinase